MQSFLVSASYIKRGVFLNLAMVSCRECGKEFEQQESMEQHYSAKHAKQNAAKKANKKPVKKLVFAAAVVAVLVLGYLIIFSNGDGEKPVIAGNDDYSVNFDEVPKNPIHWHPKLTIIIKGEQKQIPRNLGIGGSFEYPVHTHDDVPVIHYELDRPTADTATLGYFFNAVWRKKFDNNCIFDYCNGPEGNLTMTVNGKPNYQFDKYIPKDKDDIRIEFG